jgi:WD40 repeat protein
LSALAEGILGETEAAVLGSHVWSCDVCLRALEQLPEHTDPFLSRLRAAQARGPGAGQGEQTTFLAGKRKRPAPPAERDGLPAVPGYEILGELGHGGMGVVYKARHEGLNRLVALKMIRPGGDIEERARFKAEAEAVARLQHPNIVQIHEVGEAGGRPYCVLEFVEGGGLAQKLASQPLVSREAARLVEALARAMQLAHSRNLVHRDLKPANVLLTADGVPKITDFGLARQLDSDSGLTQTGAVVGTPSYMAPEQASGRRQDVGSAADVYALGAILYECLTGRPPFKGATVLETLDQVRHQEPVPPGRLQPRVPRDLETVCLKCLGKLPAQRYESAAALADDLHRFLHDQPVRARRLGLAAQGWRWCRRNPALAGLTAALLLAVAAGFAGITASYLHAEHAREQESLARAGEARQREQAEIALYESRIALAEREWLANNVARAEYLLDRCRPEEGQPDRRGWEWHYLRRLCHADLLTFQAHSIHVRGIAFSPDGRHLVTAAGLPDYSRKGEAHGEVVLWDAASGRRLRAFEGFRGQVFSVAYSPDGRRLLGLGSGGKAYLWDVASGAKLADFAAAASYQCGAAAFAPDGETLAIPNQQAVELRLAADGRLVGKLDGHQERVSQVVFSPDGTRLASADAAGTARVWDLAARRELWRTSGGQFALAFSPDGKRLAVAEGATVKLCEAGRTVALLSGHNGMVRGLAWHPGGGQVASSANDQTVRLWDAATGREERVYRGHTSPVLCVAFAPDGRRLASGGANGVVKLWDAGRDQRALDLPPATRATALCFGAGGRRLLVARTGVGVQALDTVTGQQVFEHQVDMVRRVEWPLKYVDFSADGSLLAAPGGSDPATVHIWDTQTGKEVIGLRGHRAGVRAVAFSTDGTRLASAAWDRKRGSAGELIFWELHGAGRGTPRSVLATPSPINCLAFSADGRRLFAGDMGSFVPDQRLPRDGRVVVWDADTGRPVRDWTAHRGRVQTLAVSPDGGTVASAAWDEELGLRLWDAATGTLRHALQAPPAVTVVAFSPDGRRLAAAGYEGVVRLCDPATGQDLLTLRGPAPQMIETEANDTHIAFSPDGTRLAVNCWTKAIHLFDAGPRDREGDAP